MSDQDDLTSRLNRATRESWDANAAFWDEKMGEGNAFQRVLVGPAAERLLALQPGERVLEIACGNGQFARRMASLGAQVVACDFSAKMLERAAARSTDYAGRIEYRLVDATDENQLLALGEGNFDAAVCNMGLMDMAAIDPLLHALSSILRHSGRFVFSLMHPCFNTPYTILGMEEEDREGELVTTQFIKVSRYLHQPPRKGLAIVGQPRPHIYFSRTLSQLLNACFQSGFILDGLEEPAFGPDDASPQPVSWINFKVFPPILAARLRLR